MSNFKNMRQLIWLISHIKQKGGITLRALSDKWVEEEMAEGNPLARSSFNHYRENIFDLFGLVIECDNTHHYYFANPEAIDDHSIENWLLSTMTVNAALSESASIRDQIILEKVPAGEQYLPLFIEAIKRQRRMCMGYQKFGFEPKLRMVEPYTLKLFKRRWYILVREADQFKVFSFDRMFSLEMVNERFERMKEFSPEAYFAEYFGVLTDGTPLAHIVIRAYGKMANYLRTLSLHDSQREMESTDEYTDFSLDLRPTADFIGELFSYDEGIEVIEPADLRLKIREKLERMLKRY